MVHIFNTEDKGRTRSVISQVIACMSPNLLLLDLGMAISFSTIALPDLLNASEGLSLNEKQASWFGSVPYLTQPVGALLSGPLVDYLGRKKAIFVVNVPHLIAWTFMYFAWNIPSLFMGACLLGFGTGIMEAPINSYVGEVSDPTIRGALCTATLLFTSVGILTMYFLGTVVTWRNAALICLAAPISAMLFVLLVPETPVWLLSRGREKEALKSLCYLRGWTGPENVKEEFDQLSSYTKGLKDCVICHKTNDKDLDDCEHNKMNIIKRFLLKFRYLLLCKETIRPLTLTLMYFLFTVMSGLTPIRPNMVNVCGALGMPNDGRNVVLMVGVMTFCTSVLVIGIIKILGKRKLAISAMFGTAVMCTAIAIYAKTQLSDSVFSYDTSTFPTEKSYVPLVLLYMLTVFTALAIPWVLLGEVFPFRSRSTAQGIAAAGNYAITFFASKTFINLEVGLHLWGAFAVYAAFGFAGVIYLYFFLPETEGKTLEEIETYYNGKFRTFANDPFINFFKRLKG